jgi:hypothetical protein
MTEETNTKRNPTHAIWQVIGEKPKAKWIRVGAGWANKDGLGISLKFDAYPVVGRVLVRAVTEPVETEVQETEAPE